MEVQEIEFKDLNEFGEFLEMMSEAIREESGAEEAQTGYPEEERLTFEGVRVSGEDFDLHDLTDEAWREYIYEGYTIFMETPVALAVGENKIHHVVGPDGSVVQVPPGWRYIKWKTFPHEPHING